MFKHREGLKKKQKSTKIWEIVDDILIKKKGNLLDDPIYEKDFNAFIIIRYLSMNPELLPYCNYLNRLYNNNQNSINKKQLYKLMVKLIPITKCKFQYIKSSTIKNTYIDKIMDYYNCNRREAALYFQLYGKKWADEIIKEFGGLKKY